jgi:hypothetical protein
MNIYLLFLLTVLLYLDFVTSDGVFIQRSGGSGFEMKVTWNSQCGPSATMYGAIEDMEGFPGYSWTPDSNGKVHIAATDGFLSLSNDYENTYCRCSFAGSTQSTPCIGLYCVNDIASCECSTPLGSIPC